MAGKGPGRPRKADKYGGHIAQAEDLIADRLPKIIDNLIKLADGGYERVEEEWLPAALVTIGSGEFEMKAFPDKPDDELVLVKRKVSHADSDRVANIYLADRLMGKPTDKVEVSGEDGDAIAIRVEYADADPGLTPTTPSPTEDPGGGEEV